MNKKGQVSVYVMLSLFALLVIGGFIMVFYDFTLGFGRYDISCLEKTARNYCEEKEVYFSHIHSILYVIRFSCMEELRGGDMTPFKYLNGEMEGCKK